MSRYKLAPLLIPDGLLNVDATSCLVSEEDGGIYAYGFNDDKAQEIAKYLNDACPGDDPEANGDDHWVLNFDADDHASAFDGAVRDGDFSVLLEDGKPIGLVITDNDATILLMDTLHELSVPI